LLNRGKRVWFENYHCHTVAIYTHYLHIVRAFIIFQVYQYFTVYRRYFWLKFEQISLISYTTLFKIGRYQRPFLRPKVKSERRQVALFLLCVVSPGICINVLVQLLASCVISDVNCITIPSFVFHSDYTNDSTYTWYKQLY
jgi:hypothetical protein